MITRPYARHSSVTCLTIDGEQPMFSGCSTTVALNSAARPVRFNPQTIAEDMQVAFIKPLAQRQRIQRPLHMLRPVVRKKRDRCLALVHRVRGIVPASACPSRMLGTLRRQTVGQLAAGERVYPMQKCGAITTARSMLRQTKSAPPCGRALIPDPNRTPNI